MRNIIEISGHKYECKVEDGQRLVLVYAKWMTISQFICYLREIGEWEQFAKLANFGRNVILDKIQEATE